MGSLREMELWSTIKGGSLCRLLSDGKFFLNELEWKCLS